jgi:hypothetical protein
MHLSEKPAAFIRMLESLSSGVQGNKFTSYNFKD